MVNSSKARDARFWKKWGNSGAIGNMQGRAIGEALAVFHCRAPIEQVAQEIPYIREVVRTPRRLRLEIAEKDRDYILRARATSMANSQVADEVADIINQAYQSPLYEENEPFFGRIMYREDGTNNYQTRD